MPQIVAVGVLAGLIAGLLMRGRFTAIGEAHLRLWWLGVIAPVSYTHLTLPTNREV